MVFELVKIERIESINLMCFCYTIFLSFICEAFSIDDFRKRENLKTINILLWSTIFSLIFCVRLFLNSSIYILFSSSSSFSSSSFSSSFLFLFIVLKSLKHRRKRNDINLIWQATHEQFMLLRVEINSQYFISIKIIRVDRLIYKYNIYCRDE